METTTEKTEKKEMTVNQIYKTLVLPNSPNLNMGNWLEFERTNFLDYGLRGGKMSFEKWLHAKYVGMSNLAKSKEIKKETVNASGSEIINEVKAKTENLTTSTLGKSIFGIASGLIIITTLVYISFLAVNKFEK